MTLRMSRTIAVLMGATALSTGGMEALAQNRGTGIQEIVVTARGREESLLHVPLSETVFDSRAIVDARIDQVDDFIALTPGITIANSQDSGTNFITIRGMSQTRNGEPPVAVVIDDVLQVNSRSFDQALYDVDSIEVLRGPQGALYGRNAANGAIIIHTKMPTNEFEGYIQGTAGKGDEYGVEGSISGPVVKDKILVRVSSRYSDRDGYFDNTFLGKKVDFTKEFNFRGHARFILSDDFTADVRGSLTRTDGSALNFTYQPALIDLSTGLITGFDFTKGDANQVQRQFSANNLGFDSRDVTQVSLRLNYGFDWGSIRSVSAYDKINQTTGGDQFPYSAQSTINPAGPPAFPFADGTQTQHVEVEAFSQELRVTSKDDQRLRWMLGGYYLTTNRFISSTVGDDLERGILHVQRNPFLGSPINPTTSFIADSNDNVAWAVFFNTAYDVMPDKLEVAFAGRFDKESRTQRVDARQGNYDGTGAFLSPVGSPGVTNKEHFSRFQPKVTVRYFATDDFTVYASWGRGFRSGQFNQNGVGAVAAGAGIAGVSDVLNQENSATYEAGFKSQLFDNRISASGAFYRTKVENAPYFVFIGGIGAQVLVGIDKVEIFGGEFEVKANLAEGLDAYASVGVSDSEIKTYNLNPADVGKEAPYVPKTTFNTGVQYRTPITPMLGIFGRVDFERRGKQFWDPENSTPRDAINLLNLRGGFEDNDGRWSVLASVDNVTDEVYNSEFVLGGFAHAGLPRVWRVDARVNF